MASPSHAVRHHRARLWMCHRHYGSLTGHSKKATVTKYGVEQVGGAGPAEDLRLLPLLLETCG